MDMMVKIMLKLMFVYGYGYNARATKVVGFILAIRSPPANMNKYQKRSGAKATKKLEQRESVGHELNPKEATVFRVDQLEPTIWRTIEFT